MTGGSIVVTQFQNGWRAGRPAAGGAGPAPPSATAAGTRGCSRKEHARSVEGIWAHWCAAAASPYLQMEEGLRHTGSLHTPPALPIGGRAGRGRRRKNNWRPSIDAHNIKCQQTRRLRRWGGTLTRSMMGHRGNRHTRTERSSRRARVRRLRGGAGAAAPRPGNSLRFIRARPAGQS